MPIDGAIAVLAVQFQLSSNSTTSLLTSLAPTLSAISEPGSIAETGPLDFTSLISAFSAVPVHTYAGSLTTPPCTEGPVFFISSERFPIDVETYNAMKSVVGFNSRFIQNTLGSQNVLVLAAEGEAIGAVTKEATTETTMKIKKASRFCFEVEK
jgi:carbonic anhydrase